MPRWLPIIENLNPAGAIYEEQVINLHLGCASYQIVGNRVLIITRDFNRLIRVKEGELKGLIPHGPLPGIPLGTRAVLVFLVLYRDEGVHLTCELCVSRKLGLEDFYVQQVFVGGQRFPLFLDGAFLRVLRAPTFGAPLIR